MPIPSGFLKGSAVEIKVKAGSLVVSPARKRRYDLKELVDRITRENRHGLLDRRKPVGKEAG